MSDFDNEDEFLKKLQEQEDDVKPIDIGGRGAPPLPGGPMTPTPGAPPLPGGPNDLGGFPPPPAGTPSAFENSELINAGEEFRQEVPPDIAAKMATTEFKLIKRGEYIDLLRKDPTLKRIRMGAGWEQRLLEEESLDIDLSAFILDREDMTRADEDFIFYGQQSGLDGGIKHLGDSRNGAGEGDDEAMTIDLNAVPFDVQKIVFVLSIYDEESKGFNFSMVRDVFLRLVNDDDQNEIVRFVFDDEEMKGGNGAYMATLIREGPKWTFEAQGTFINGGLAEIATKYGIIVRELQSTG